MLRLGTLALALAAAAALGVSSCYSPDPVSGGLSCGPSNSCPDGYSCSSGKCFKGGAGGRDGGGSDRGGSDGGTNPDAPMPSAKFIGTWVFAATSSLMITCSDGTSDLRSLQGDFFEVTAGTVADLAAGYYCIWNLDVASSGTMAGLAGSGQNCPFTNTDNQYVYTYRGNTFNLTTADGVTGAVSSSITADFRTPTNATGTCSLTFSGPLTKQR